MRKYYGLFEICLWYIVICRIEIALRLIDPTLAIPYWDSVMDSYLPNPRDSIIWSPLFAGETDSFGRVVNGPRLGFEGRLFTETDIGNVLNQQDISNVLAFTAPQAGNYFALKELHSTSIISAVLSKCVLSW
ncbi:unnamed protein product [Gongylonema pulchrum]|uniref:Tyrosinase_Cu-bd domain-containing protein n=1 Tax=Gongylonema pulchrum TaxID=637853 RepID=A0A183D207_9BILA|nr:unnamed protein product [Gongylonema pulchrum]